MATNQYPYRSGNPAWGGILLSIFGNLTGPEVFKTVLLAVIGTVVSYITSALLKKIANRVRK